MSSDASVVVAPIVSVQNVKVERDAELAFKKEDIVVFNVYVPPASSCPAQYSPDIGPLLNFSSDDVLILGDLNAHHDGWHSSRTDARGRIMADTIETSLFLILNEAAHTRLPSSGVNSSPDVLFGFSDFKIRPTADHYFSTIR